MDRIIDEAYQVAERKDVRLLWNSAGEYQELFYGKLLPATYDHQSSTLQDLQRGRPTEINSLNGQIWRYGKPLSIPTPYNETMTRLMLGGRRNQNLLDLLCIKPTVPIVGGFHPNGSVKGNL